jgi:hypothetical protein
LLRVTPKRSISHKASTPKLVLFCVKVPGNWPTSVRVREALPTPVNCGQ